MSIIENDIIMQKKENGNTKIMYPTTKLDNIIIPDNYEPAGDDSLATKKYVDSYFKQPSSQSITVSESHTGSYYFVYDSSSQSYKNNNQNVDDSSAISTIVISQPCNVSWNVDSESDFDELTIEEITNDDSNILVDHVSGSKSGILNINNSTTLKITYSKDSSSSSGTDTAVIKFIEKVQQYFLPTNYEPLTTYEPLYDGSPATKKYVDDAIAESSSNSEAIYSEVIGGWHMHTDGENLTESVGFTSEDYDNLQVGRILTYPSSTDSGATVETIITYVSYGSGYKPGGGRFSYKTIGTGISGYSYEFSCDSFYTGDVFKGLTLDGDSGGGAVACFTANTKVLTKSGLKNIDDIKIGELILSYNKEENINELKEVDKLVSHITNDIYEIEIGTEIIKASWSHPFYTDNKGIVLAKDLKVGDLLRCSDEKLIKIKSVNIIKDANEKVYEIRVKDNNNYYVGNNQILVYNEESIL